MYNNNYYQNSNYYHSYYSQQPINSGYNHNNNYSNLSRDKSNYQINNRHNRVIKLYTLNNIQYSNNSNNNYLTKSPIQTPIKNYLNNNNNYQPNKHFSKSPEPYIRLYKKNINSNYNYNQNNNHITNLNVNIKPINYPLNIKINNIQNVNRIIKISPYKVPNQNIYHARTPEPNLRRRNKLKQKKIKANNFITKTFIPINTYDVNNVQNKNTHDINHVNKTEYLNIPKDNYININSINNKPLYSNLSNNGNIQNNNIITNYSRVNYYSANYNHNKNRHHSSINTNNKDYIVNLNTKNNDNSKNKLKSYNLNFIHYDIHPQSNFNSAEFIIINSIGEGSFGKIYCVQWIKNNKLYAMKKLEIQTTEELNEFKKKVKIVDDLYKKTNHIGFVKLYADKVVILYNQPFCYNYYVIMELGDRDWEKEIQLRLLHQKYYTEYELYQIIYQLVKTLSIMQQNNVTHRDIKPANVLIMNGIYKICDFGEASIINGNGVVIQSVRGSQLFMSPILFYAYNHNVPQVMHNTYKSDVYSFGMCILLAATLSGYTLYDIREILDIQQVSKIIINKLRSRYSINFINLLLQMLQIDENLRMDFIHLENYIRSFYKF